MGVIEVKSEAAPAKPRHASMVEMLEGVLDAGKYQQGPMEGQVAGVHWHRIDAEERKYFERLLRVAMWLRSDPRAFDAFTRWERGE